VSGRTFEIRERILTGDVDAGGGISVGAYVRLIDAAEIALYGELGLGGAAMLEENEIALPRVHLAFDFFQPAGLGDEVVVRTTIKGVGAHSTRLFFEFARADGEGIYAEAHVVSSAVDRKTRRSKALPDQIAKALRAELPAD
jgi:acyl-CoA thioesterase FadM